MGGSPAVGETKEREPEHAGDAASTPARAVVT
jgi:hypothetical protein